MGGKEIITNLTNLTIHTGSGIVLNIVTPLLASPVIQNDLIFWLNPNNFRQIQLPSLFEKSLPVASSTTLSPSGIPTLFTHPIIEGEPIIISSTKYDFGKNIFPPPVNSDIIQRLFIYREIRSLFNQYSTLEEVQINNYSTTIQSIFSRSDLPKLDLEIELLDQQFHNLVYINDQSIITPQSIAELIANRYIILKQTNQLLDKEQGGMGKVITGWDTVLQKPVKVKSALDIDDTPITEVEAQLTAKLRHINIVTTYDLVKNPDITYYVMDYVEGITLDESIKERQLLNIPYTLTEQIKLLSTIASAIDYIHQFPQQTPLFHGDIKENNIIINPKLGPIVIDFGRSQPTQQFYNSEIIFGTPLYISPTQLAGKPISQEEDKRSLMLIAFHLITNQFPFKGNTVDNVVNLISQNNWDHNALLQIFGQSSKYSELEQFFDDCFGQNNNIYKIYPTATALINRLEELINTNNIR